MPQLRATTCRSSVLPAVWTCLSPLSCSGDMTQLSFMFSLQEGAVFGCPIKKLAWPAFTLSIAWIGIASYFMVMSASIVGDTFGIPAQACPSHPPTHTSCSACLSGLHGTGFMSSPCWLRQGVTTWCR